MNFNYCSLLYEYDFPKLNAIINYYSNHFIIYNIINYELNEIDIKSFINILYSHDIYCNEIAINSKINTLTKYFNDTKKKSINLKFIILKWIDNDKYNDKTNNFIRNIKKELRKLIIKLNDNKQYYLPIHITDHKTDSMFLELVIHKLTTSYTLKSNNKILDVRRNLNNYSLFKNSSILIFFSNTTEKHKEDKIFLGNNHSSNGYITDIKNSFKYNVGLSNLINFRKKIKNIDEKFHIGVNFSSVIEVTEFILDEWNNISKKLNDKYKLISKKEDIEIYSADNGIYLLINNDASINLQTYIHEQSKNKMLFALKSNVKKLYNDIQNYLKKSYEITGSFIIKTNDKEKTIKKIYKKDSTREKYMNEIMNTWDDISMWFICEWNTFKCYVNTSVIKLIYRKYNSNVIHSIDYPDEYLSTIIGILSTNIKVYNILDTNDFENKLDLIYKSKDIFNYKNKNILHNSHRSSIELFTDNEILVKKNIKLQNNYIDISEKHGLIDNINHNNCLQFMYIDNDNCITKFSGIPLHGWHSNIEDIIKTTKFQFQFSFDIKYIKYLINSIRNIAINMTNNKIYHNDLEAYNICLDSKGKINIIDFERYGYREKREIRYTIGNLLKRFYCSVFTSPLYLYMCYKHGNYYLPFINADEFINVKSKLKNYNFNYNIDNENMIISYNIEDYKNILKILLHINKYRSIRISFNKDKDKYELNINDKIFYPFLIKKGTDYI